VHDDTQPAAGDSDTSSGDWCGLGVSPAIVREWYVSYIELLRRYMTKRNFVTTALQRQRMRFTLHSAAQLTAVGLLVDVY
jgi:hypothetical protein